jgi:hypothetical protein
MAEAGGMNIRDDGDDSHGGDSLRARLDADLDALECMLPPWREKLRDEAQFWPQFTALADGILANAAAADLDHARQRIADMLAKHGLVPDRMA